jgi:hypothetical protein
MRKTLLVLLLAIGLTACAGRSKEQVVFDSWAVVCESYATMNIVLAPGVADGSISDAGVELIDDARALIGPNCTEGAPMPDLNAKPSRAIQQILLQLQGLSV